MKHSTDLDFNKFLQTDRFAKITKDGHRECPSPQEIYDQFGQVTLFKLDTPYAGVTQDKSQILEVYPKYILEHNFDLPDMNINNAGTVGILVNANQNKLFVYSGVMAHACLNLNIFADTYVQDYVLSDVNNLKALIQNARDAVQTQYQLFKDMQERLTAEVYSTKDFQERKGFLLDTISESLFPYLVNAESLMRDANTIYKEMPNTDWKILQAMTDNIKNKSVINRIKTTRELEVIFN